MDNAKGGYHVRFLSNILLAIKKEEKSRGCWWMSHVCVDKDPDISRHGRKRGKSIHQERDRQGDAVHINYAGGSVNSYNGRKKSITYN
jgi:hypothetical protein